jgi:hypothetical protein
MDASKLPMGGIEVEVHSTYCENPPQSDQDNEDQKSNLEDSILPSIEIFNEKLLRDTVQGLAISADDIPTLKAFHLEIEEIQVNDSNSYLDEAVVANDLLPPIHFQRIPKDIQVGHDLPIYPPIPNDPYQGPIDIVHISQAD